MTSMTNVTLADLDLFEQAPPWQVFDELRAQAPVHWDEEEAPNHGFWSLTGYHDIVHVLRDTETFSSEKGTVNLEELDADQIEARKSMLETDGVRHRALRRLMQGEFTPKAVAGYETFLRGLTATTLDQAFALGEFDFVAEVAADFPIRVLARMLDVPDADIHQLIDWGNRMVGNTDPEHADVLADSEESEKYRLLPFRSPAAQEVFDYGRALADRRRGRSGVDLVSRLVNQEPMDGIPLSERDFNSYFLLLVVAGNETTRHTITHSMNYLMQNPDQLELLQERPELIPWAVEEFLRLASPVYHFRRTATRDTEIRGQAIKQGDKVVTWFAAGNRDPQVFDDPYRMDVTRNPNEHMAFGRGGPHMCMGNALARLEIKIMFEDLLPRITSVQQMGEVSRLRSNFVNGIKRFPVKVELK
ncbi:cytochrome P450 [Marisediminicola antarctica]|uniref:Cytochrome n=1 Tax=Marisediminicola antarctica TaxID=674079 RepID=A0A7L5AL00_9MICO|nr:cytochrome P450 [Marisediminicola antarctica]QHO70485.1 cytochrome [Marisediminicola antarctica]